MKHTKKILMMLLMVGLMIEATNCFGDYGNQYQTLYAPDGRTEEVKTSDVEAQLTVGWYIDPVKTLYALDGRTEVVKEKDVPDQLTVGWYEEPVQLLYAADGRTEVFKSSEVEEQLTVGWFKTPEEAEDSKWIGKAQQYPVATKIWRLMKSYGWNDYVCAGIMGNMMAEVGGQSFNLNWNSSNSNYYGLCQWNRAYKGSVWGASIENQVAFLASSVAKEINTYGRSYGINYDSFLNLTDEKAVALNFARCYERCGSASYSVRQSNATKAYLFFAN